MQNYADPEHYPQRDSKKSDVYFYGMVLLELISGKKTKLEDTVIAWTKPWIQWALRNQDYKNLVNSKLLQMDYNKKEMEAMISCAAVCIYKPSNSRPKMNQIVRVIEEYISIEEIWNEKNDNIFLKDNPESSGSNNIELNGSQKLKPHVSSKANESHNFEPNEAQTVESNGSLEPKPLVSSEVNGSHNVELNGSQKPYLLSVQKLMDLIMLSPINLRNRSLLSV
ncbi:proline-rich receptor-like protein kinase PERK3 [Hevea brasiliensis]|uniref:proline-rich receptor-like protein kinase PERK3 n=1 Tax=Hevea brasiliensis TaxID=3981 RepID=UPI0025EF75E0|nr:proline-rich receptor-like protein kinase PERK3 [Hevea brasiliensis]